MGRCRCFLAILIAVALLAITACSSDATRSVPPERPRLGDHWHTYLGVDICGQWLPTAPSFETRDGSVDLGSFGSNTRAGIHTHGDFIIHDHPFARDETGANNTLGRFLSYAQSKITASSIELWPVWAAVKYQNGERCPNSSERAVVRWKVGHLRQPWPSRSGRGDPSNIRLRNGDIIAIYFVPVTVSLDAPPGADAALLQLADLGGTVAVPPS